MAAVEKGPGSPYFPCSTEAFLTQAFTGLIMDLFLDTNSCTHHYSVVVIIEGFKFHCM